MSRWARGSRSRGEPTGFGGSVHFAELIGKLGSHLVETRLRLRDHVRVVALLTFDVVDEGVHRAYQLCDLAPSRARAYLLERIGHDRDGSAVLWHLVALQAGELHVARPTRIR